MFSTSEQMNQPAPMRGRTLRERLKAARAARGMSQSTVAKHVKVSRGAVGQWESGVSEPTRENVEKLSALLRVGFEWLSTGKGQQPGSEAVIATYPGVDPAQNRIQELDVRAGMGGGGVLDHPVRQDGKHIDPVKDEPWIFPAVFTREVLHASAGQLVIAEVQGDSMFPTLAHGERVVINTGHKVPTPDGIYALRDRFDTIVVKRLQARRDAPRLRIISDNSNHEDEEVGVDEITILGRVVCALKLV